MLYGIGMGWKLPAAKPKYHQSTNSLTVYLNHVVPMIIVTLSDMAENRLQWQMYIYSLSSFKFLVSEFPITFSYEFMFS